MNRAGHDFLAGAVLAEDQHGQIGIGDATRGGTQRVDRRRIADEPHARGGFFGQLTPRLQEPFALLRILQRRGGMRGELDECLFIVVGKVSFALVEHFEDPEHFAAARDERHAEQRAGAIAELLIDLAGDLFLAVAGVDALRRARAQRFADDAEIVGDAEFVPFDAERGPADELMVRTIPKEDAGPIGREHLRGGFGHLHQQRLHFLRLIPTSGDFQERGEPFVAAALLFAGPHRGEPLREVGAHEFHGLLHAHERRGVGRVQGDQLAGGRATIDGEREPTARGGGRFPVEHVGEVGRREGRAIRGGRGAPGPDDRPAAVDVADHGDVVGPGRRR